MILFFSVFEISHNPLVQVSEDVPDEVTGGSSVCGAALLQHALWASQHSCSLQRFYTQKTVWKWNLYWMIYVQYWRVIFKDIFTVRGIPRPKRAKDISVLGGPSWALRYIFFLCRIFFVNCSFNSIVLVFFIKAKDLNSFSAIGLFSFRLCKSWCDLIRDDMTWYFIKCLVIKMLFFGVENTTFYMFDTRVPLINSFLYCTFIPLIKSG